MKGRGSALWIAAQSPTLMRLNVNRDCRDFVSVISRVISTEIAPGIRLTESDVAQSALTLRLLPQSGRGYSDRDSCPVDIRTPSPSPLGEGRGEGRRQSHYFIVGLRLIFVWLLFPLSFAIVSSAAVGTAAERNSWQAEWEKAIAGAKKEGAVSLWGDAEITHPDIVAAFTKEFPFIKPVTVTGRVGDLTLRILSERRAGKFLADLYSGVMGGAAFYEFYKTGVLDSVKSKFILPEVKDESKWLGGKHHFVDPDTQQIVLYEGNVAGTSIYYNTQSVNLNEFSSYWDLVDPKWKGKIVMFERAGSGFPGLTPVYYNPRLGPEFLKRLLGDIGVTVSRDRRQATDWLASGKYPLCIGCGDIEHAAKDGLPVAELERKYLKEAGHGIGLNGNSGLALMSKAAHPNAAALFINWFLSRRGQILWQEIMNTKVDEPSNSMRVDIPKDKVLPAARREDKVTYTVTGFLDPGPPSKLIDELLGRKKAN
jgi:ABC-type Fe3+ transport system substrate-binding protein